MKISSAITTVRRKGADYLPDTLDSIIKSGFFPMVVEDEPRVGAYRNFKRALTELVQEDADAVLVFQDDIVVSARLRLWLEYTLWPCDPETIGCVSLYTATPHDQPDDGWHQLDLEMKPDGKLPWGQAHGALALLFPMQSAIEFLASNIRPESLSGIDLRVAEWCMLAGKSYWMHSPSLVDHRGEISTFEAYNLATEVSEVTRRCRRAGRFCADASELRLNRKNENLLLSE